MKRHPELAREFWKNPEKALSQNASFWFFRTKRDKAAGDVKDFEGLRSLSDEIKRHAITHLGHYLEEFERNAQKRGITVHWAKDGSECNEIIARLAKEKGATKVIKSKSMLSEEIHLNAALEAKGMEVCETDLGERIIQFRNERPSHIVVPAMHLTKEDVGKTFHEKIGTPEAQNDPTFLTHAARAHLRNKYLEGQLGVSGVNFAIAETGEIVLCTNEGNADLTIGLAPVHVAIMGIEKVIPKLEHLSVFTTLLARSATGQPITVYTTHVSAPREGGEMHVVIVDNRRSTLLGEPRLFEILKCIRCGACLNTCPVYRRSGGYSYNYLIPGPVGSVLGPFYQYKQYYDMSYACSLCASCSNVCPAKIPLDQLLFHHHQNAEKEGTISFAERILFKCVAGAMESPKLFDLIKGLALPMMRLTPSFLLRKLSGGWGRYREMPYAVKTFRQLLKKYQVGRGK